jgi:uncharacterized protein with beta-barrel porin domain/tRNA A-37 threonylcarbamoyl transferase component Bud32
MIALLVAAPVGAQQVIEDGDNATVTSAADGETITAAAGVTSTVADAPVVVVANNDVTVDNAGTLATTGVTQTVQDNQGTTGAEINNAATGRIEAESRAVNFDGTDATLNNDGAILGTGDQRNGTVYANRTSNNITINNSATGSIDAGMGNDGAGIAIEVGGGGAPRGGAITNAGTIQGRGQASPMGGTAGDGIRFFGPGLAPEYVYEGDITNSGLINSESTQGTVAGIRFANRIGFQGTLTNEADGVISGAQNGLYFGNDADHMGGVVNNLGTISSDSRALNIDGERLVVNNSGSIVGTGNQRNGTVYADSTAQNFTLNNEATGVIDAGEGNEGAAFSVELSSAATDGNAFDIVNAGTIQGRGNASAGATTAGDGLRFERTRVDGALDATTDGLFIGSIANSGLIDSEGDSGTTAGIRFVNGVSFQGELNNSGTISGVQNGLYFGNPTPAGGGDFSQAIVNNLAGGVISSGSRALNIDGNGLTVNNAGTILGTGNQRNGTVYADSTAQNFTLNNEATGVIDAGMGNEGAAFSVELSSAATGGNAFDIVNAGTIQGRGNAGAGLATAGDGLRFERTRVDGALDATTDGLFVGNITNSGTIASEAANGTAGGIRFVNGVSFQGVLENSGTITGVQNGLYFGNPTPAGGGDFSQAIVNNSGVISSGSRALNIDGVGLTVNNLAGGQILGLGNQRNGTVYADGTADNFTLTNAGTVDAGMGNEGSGFGAEVGGAADGANSFTLTNSGAIQGRGQAAAGTNGAGDGVRIGNVGNTGVTDAVIVNSGLIKSESTQGTTAGLRVVNGVDFQGEINNSGTISGGNHGVYLGAGDHTGATFTNSGALSGGVNAFFAGNALSALNFSNDGGTLVGNFVGTVAFEDTLTITGTGNSIQGDILNSVAVTMSAESTTAIVGARTLNGSLTHSGTLSFELGADSLAVEGDATLAAGSVINIGTAGTGAANIGQTIDVLTETGTFTDNGAIINVIEDDFLVDYSVILGSLQVAVTAANLGAVSGDANINSFGTAITTAAINNRLPADVFGVLNGAGSTADFEAAALDLLPAINDGVTREIFETQRFASRQVQKRLGTQRSGLWGEAFYREGDSDASSLSSLGYDASAAGFTLGLDGKLGETTTLGVFANYSDVDVDAGVSAFNEANVDAFQFGAYAGFDLGGAFVNAELGYSTSSVEESRAAAALVETITSDSDVDGVFASLNAGLELGSDSIAITPSVGLRYADLLRDTFTEEGGLDLTLDSAGAEFIEGRVGVKIASNKDKGFVPFASVDYAYDFGSDPLAVVGSFNGGADSFTLVANEASASRFDVGVGADFVSDDNFSIGAEYRGRFASGYQSHSGGIRLRLAF